MRSRSIGHILAGCSLVLFLIAACSTRDDEPIVIYVTATPSSERDLPVEPTTPLERADLSPVPLTLPVQPTSDQPRGASAPGDVPQEHIVQPGDTLFGIGLIYGVSLDSILAVNDLENPNALVVGQVIQLPAIPTQSTPSMKLIADSRFVRGPGNAAFDVAGFVAQQPGYIRTASDEVVTRLSDGSERRDLLSAAEVVERVGLEFSVDPRLLLALLEYRAGWLSDSNVAEGLRTYPMIREEDSGGIDRAGLYKQLAWTANNLNWGYYGWKFRDWRTLEFSADGTRLLYESGLNAGTVGLQYFLSLFRPYDVWRHDVNQNGFFATYFAYFGDPLVNALDPLVPPGLSQPEMTLPYAEDETWFFTGGWHGGWGSGSAWAALDFAPPDDPPDGVFCYVSNYPVRAVATGVIARSGNGTVILDLDGDGDESTGWTVLYLHLAAQNRITAGSRVQTGDIVGYASCEGGFSTATHLHIGRRYNGEWIPADCSSCSGQDIRPSFNMGGWTVIGLQNQEYQGFLDRGGDRRIAEQGRFNPANRVSW